jgi:hypothetical protein
MPEDLKGTRAWNVKGIDYIFPESFSDEKVQGILAQQGVIKLRGPKPNAKKDAMSMGGPPKKSDADQSYSGRFMEGVTRGLLPDPETGGPFAPIFHPWETAKAIPGMVADVVTGKPETIGAIGGGAPWAAALGIPGARALPEVPAAISTAARATKPYIAPFTDRATLTQAAKMGAGAGLGYLTGGGPAAELAGALLIPGSRSLPELFKRGMSAIERAKPTRPEWVPPREPGISTTPAINPAYDYPPAGTVARPANARTYPKGSAGEPTPGLPEGVYSPVPPVSTRATPGPSVPLSPAPKPAGVSIPPIAQEGSPVSSSASTFKHPANYTDLLRQFHSQWPKGTSLREIASKAYGLPAGTLPSYEQALAIHEFMLRNSGKTPSPGDLIP